MRIPNRTRSRRRAPIAMVILVGAVALSGCTRHPAPPISAADLKTAQAFKEFTVYWAGLKVDHQRLTAADNLSDFNSAIGFAMYYGDCEGRGTFRTAGCVLPLKITTVRYVPHSNESLGPQRNVRLRGMPAVVYHSGNDIELYTDQQSIDVSADSPELALAAVRALEPFNRVPTANFPAFPKPYFRPGVSQEELDAEAAARGSTGVTGATSDIAPPAALEPTP